MNNNLLLTLTFTLVALTTNLSTANTYNNLAQQVLDKIYASNGNMLFLKPSLEIVDETWAVATYYPRANVIKLEKRAIDICQSFGADGEAALAFIIGHELAHAFQRSKSSFAGPSSYLELGLTDVAHSKEKEREADIFGVFSAYLSGYKTIKILPTLIQKLYEGYGLVEKPLVKYPELGIRKRTAREVRKKVEELVQIFEVANHLSVIGEHELAASSYQYISKYYQGPEVLNNEGVAHTLHAINFSANNVDDYLYPLEIDWNSRLRKPRLLEGDRALTPTEQRYRQKYLLKALEKFKEALLLNPNYFSADINIISVLSLMGQHQQAIDYYYKNHTKFLLAKPNQQVKADLAFAIAQTKFDLSASNAIWEKYSNNSNPAIAYQAKFNLEKNNYQKFVNSINGNLDCNLPISIDTPIDRISLERINQPNLFTINEVDNLKLGIRKTSNSMVYQFNSPKGKFVIQRVIKNGNNYQKITTNSKNVILSTNGSFYICPSQRAAFLLGEYGALIEWSKYYDGR